MKMSSDIEKKLGSWSPLMTPLVESELWDNLYRFLKSEVVDKKKTIIPKSNEVWKSLQLCDRYHVKAIILLQCPYATQRQQITIANGIPMDCTNIAPYQQPSLLQWYSAIEAQYGFNPDNDLRCNLDYLLIEEHILLLNVANTVELGKVDSHMEIWSPITQWFCENIISKWLPGVPVVMVGNQAQKFERFLNPMRNPLKKVEHPAAAAHQNREWAHGNMHKWIDSIIRANNGESEVPQWTRKKGQQGREKVDQLPQWVRETEYGKKVDGVDVCNDLPWDN